MMGSVCALVAAKSEAGVPITKTLNEIRHSVPSLDGTIEGVRKHAND